MEYFFSVVTYMFTLVVRHGGRCFQDVFAGATETSRITIEWAMSELVKNPRAMAKAQLEVRKVLGQQGGVITNNDLGDLHYMRMVIKEVLRLHPPAPLLP